MRACEVHLNGKKLCIAGIERDGVLSAIVSWVARPKGNDCFRHLGSLTSETKEHIDWVKHDSLKVGDKIEIPIADADTLDEPPRRKADTPGLELEAKKNYFRRMAKEIGWTIQESSKEGSNTKKR